MNWLLFTSQKFDKFDKIEKLLSDNNGNCTIINIEDVASDTVDSSLFATLSNSSYAIFNLPNEFVYNGDNLDISSSSPIAQF